MTTLSNFLLKSLSAVETVYDQSSFYVKKKLSLLDPLIIQAYFGFGNTEKVLITGRVLEAEGQKPPQEGASLWENIQTMYRRYESDEIPHVRVKIFFQGLEQVVKTDSEGYFHVMLEGFELEDSPEEWYDIYFELLDEVYPEQGEVKGQGKVLIPNKSEYGVISDVDDTILVSRSSDLIKKAQLTFFNNARTRTPFKGVSAFYQSLYAGSDGKQHNPIFYVSSSPWNLYELLEYFCEVHEIPKGPFLLRGIGIDKDTFIKSGHGKHKIIQITTLFLLYPDMQFILIGDSGQKDPEIYEFLSRKYPSHIKAIYIRDVTHDKRDKEVREIAKQVKSRGIDMVLAEDTSVPAIHALEQGLVTQESVEHLMDAIKQEDK
ncbi:phosphatidate phosphatase APP1 [Catalinimonas alkaloidigena]|uniref:App1 family protein n=1 Tax=Catalinimonas alkaloidigena TaxID=1075417 RepID=UPI002405BD9A|nr:phosphatase domain-containing protein [Catalinimonas alkaloidigena]MDF9796830.1 phosphatidate phosphatase APP1 [Catalinimonas alkaloidigena]